MNEMVQKLKQAIDADRARFKLDPISNNAAREILVQIGTEGAQWIINGGGNSDSAHTGQRMTGLNQYQQEVKRTSNRDLKAYPECLRAAVAAMVRAADGIVGPDDPSKLRQQAQELLKIWDRLIWGLGLAGEAGEVTDGLKKKYGHGKAVSDEYFKLELGDGGWYGNALADSFGFTAEDVATANSVKLRKRHPVGFTVESANAKADEAPRQLTQREQEDAEALAQRKPMCWATAPVPGQWMCNRGTGHPGDHIASNGYVILERWAAPAVFHACGARDPSPGQFQSSFPCRLTDGHDGDHISSDGQWSRERIR